MSSSFINRTISGAVLLLITIGCLYFKGIPLILYSFLIATFSFYEMIKTLNVKSKDTVFAFSTLFIAFTLYAIVESNLVLTLTSILIYTFLVFLVYLFNEKINLQFPMALVFSYMYIIIPMGLFLNMGFTGKLWFVFMISWGTDTFAYIFGLTLGRHKLCPTISPKKTIEGSFGGIFGSILTCLLVNYYFFKDDVVLIIVLAIFGSIFAQVGDLFASRIKREFDIKDFSNLILGHGGVLDRYDSILFVTPIVYIVVNLFGGI